MKKSMLFIIAFLCNVSFLIAQEKVMIHRSGAILHESLISEVDSIKFVAQTSTIALKSGAVAIPISLIDSITFARETVDIDENTIYITYQDEDVLVVNPFEGDGVVITVEQFHVTVASVSEVAGIKYHLSGTTADGSLVIDSEQPVTLLLDHVSITNPAGAALNITKAIETTVYLAGGSTNNLSDATSATANAALLTKGSLIFEGLGSLTVSGYNKHAISSSKIITMNNGSILIPQAASDGFHSESFVMNGGFTDISATGDGIDAGAGTVDIYNGIIKITSAANDVKGIKGDDILSIHGGMIEMTITGAQSKGLSSKKDIIFNGGYTAFVTSGGVVMEALGSGYDPSYCTAIKTKENVIVNDGTIKIESTRSCEGGKGISADGDIVINNGRVTISMAGDGNGYTNENGELDSFTSCAIKSDGNISIYAGTITCQSSGTGGKGISADGTLALGTAGADNGLLRLSVTTTGERFYVSGTGENADYANPKAVKSEGDLTVNSGTITIRCTQNDEGGEGLESKSTLTIHGGIIDIEAYDDCINASNHIEVTGGSIYLTSSGNDGMDSNGTLSISGGLIITAGTNSPEGGIDCDQSRFAITGGTVIATGGGSSTPTASASTQYSIMYAGTPESAICIKNASEEVILLYQMPAYSSSSGSIPGGPGGIPGGGPGGGNSQMEILFSSARLSTGNYTLLYGGTITGGTTDHGYNTGGTYSGGTSKSFTISNKVTTIR